MYSDDSVVRAKHCRKFSFSGLAELPEGQSCFWLITGLVDFDSDTFLWSPHCACTLQIGQYFPHFFFVPLNVDFGELTLWALTSGDSQPYNFIVSCQGSSHPQEMAWEACFIIAWKVFGKIFYDLTWICGMKSASGCLEPFCLTGSYVDFIHPFQQPQSLFIHVLVFPLAV